VNDFFEKVAGMTGFHTVRKTGERWACTCQGFIFHKKCKHITEIKNRELENEIFEKYERGEDVSDITKLIDD